MPMNPTENSEIYSILPRDDENQESQYDLVPTDNTAIYSLVPQESSNQNYALQERQVEPANGLERFTNRYWEDIYNRINHQAIIEDFMHANDTERESGTELEPLDNLLRLTHFSFWTKYLATASPADRATLKYWRTIEQLNVPDYYLNTLEELNILNPTHNPKYELQTEKEPIESLLENTKAQITELLNLYTSYATLHRDIWVNDHPWTSYLVDINNLINREITLERGDYNMISAINKLVPTIRRNLIIRGSIPDLEEEQLKEQQTHQEAQKTETPKLHGQISFSEIPDSDELVVTETEIKEQLQMTIPYYFHQFIGNISLKHFYEQSEVVGDTADGSYLGVADSQFEIDQPKPSYANIYLYHKFGIGKYDPNGPIDIETWRNLKGNMGEAIENTLLHEAAHAILPQFSIPELFEWVDIYKNEVEYHELATNRLARYKSNKEKVEHEGFAILYAMYLKDPQLCEEYFPQSSEFIGKIFRNYTSPSQASLVARYRDSYRYYSSQLTQDNTESKEARIRDNYFF